MVYLLAAVAAVTTGLLLWKAFGPDTTSPPGRGRSVAPDDDPDFLRGIGRPDEDR